MRRGWTPVECSIPVAVRRSTGTVETDWEMLAAKMVQGKLFCRVWRFKDGDLPTLSVSAEDLGLVAHDIPTLQRELRASSASLIGGNKLETTGSTGESIQADALAFRSELQTLPDELLKAAQVLADKALAVWEPMFDQAAKIRTLIGLGADASRFDPRKRDLLFGTLPEDAQRSMVQAREIYLELERRAEERLRTLQARRQKLDAMMWRD